MERRVERAEFWEDTIRDYTARQLTEEGDKGKAVDGVAKAIQIRLGLTSHAHGMFLEYIQRLLLWYPKRSLQKPKKARGKHLIHLLNSL